MNKSRTVMSSLAAIWAVGGFAASVVTEGTVTTLDVPEGGLRGGAGRADHAVREDRGGHGAVRDGGPRV